MSEKEIFIRQIRHRSNEHIRAMEVLSAANIPSQMIAVLRQELDSMVRVIYLLSQEPSRQTQLGNASNQLKWCLSIKAPITFSWSSME
ncbi:hypothetical protein ACET98_23350, partial [Aeromonas veronii]